MAETGHAKNVENWQKMIATCSGFGGDYKSSNVNLTIASMTTLLTDVETVLKERGYLPRNAERRLSTGFFTLKRPIRCVGVAICSFH